MRKVFWLDARPAQATLFYSGLGWSELKINGKAPDDRVLSPAVMQYDIHVPYVEYDVAELLHSGENTIEVLLGNGWYSQNSGDT
ncbi:MAG: alpha-L-rhamnosidase N-terminal domain-containing protein [Victivallaceae bacterium]|nr:alpha-L-rhamnosidase N-terminal domain-containing protein [Victivallaceae bacterium]